MGTGRTNDRRRAMLLFSAAMIGGMTAPASAQAGPGQATARPQTDQSPESEDASRAKSEQIIVTGSRIARSTVSDELYPTVEVTSQDIARRGFFNTGEALINNPIFSSLSNSDTRFAQSRQDIGFTFVNLFGLGSERTLTVVDGKRVVSSISPQPNRSSGQSGLQVDIGVIPTALIERIETIAVGGAPAYGADAVAGTVNIILKKRFTGAQLDAQSGVTGRGDGSNKRISGLIGIDFGPEKRGNLIVSGEYAQRDGIVANDRMGANDVQLSDVRLATSGATFFNITPPQPLNVFSLNTGIPGLSSYGVPIRNVFGIGTAVVFGNTPVGFANSAGQNLAFDPRGNLVPIQIGQGTGTFAFTQNQPSFPGLYRQFDYATIQNTSERAVGSILGRYEIAPAVSFHFRAFYSDLKAREAGGSPILLGLGAAAAPTISLNNPFLSPSARATLSSATASGTAALFGSALPLVVNNSFQLGRTLNEFELGTRAHSKTFSAQAGLEGDFNVGGRKFNWDVTYSYGKTTTDTITPLVKTTAFNNAIDAVVVDGSGALVTDPALYAPQSAFTFNGLGYAAANGQRIVCRSSVGAAGSSCIPFNLIGAINPQQAIGALAFDSILHASVRQQFVQANVTGSPFDLPAGAAQFAVGAEYRDERASYSTDPTTAAGGGLTLSGSIAPISDGFKSREAYAEVTVPLISDKFIGGNVVNLLAAEGSARYIDNNRAGSDWVYTLGGRARLFDTLTLRGNHTRSVRAPGIGQIAGQSPSFTAVPDPCAITQITRGPAPANRRNNCQAAVVAAGLAPNTAAAATFLSTYTGAVGGISGLVGGNPNLQNEVARSWTVGGTLAPRAIPNMSLSVDYNAIRVNGAIQSLTAGDVVASCFDTANFPGATCGQFTRNPANFNLTGFKAGFVNTGLIDFAGITSTARLQLPINGDRERILLNATWFRLTKYRTQNTSALAIVENKGIVGYERDRIQGQVGVGVGVLNAFWTTTFTAGAFLDTNARDGVGNPTFAFSKTRASYIHDVSLVYDVNSKFEMRLIANNITDFKQPVELKQFDSVQSRIGRSFVVGVTARY